MNLLDKLITKPEIVKEKSGYTAHLLTFTVKTGNLIGLPAGIFFAFLFCLPAGYIMSMDLSDVLLRLGEKLELFYLWTERITNAFGIKNKTMVTIFFMLIMGIIVAVVLWLQAFLHELTHAIAWTIGTPLRIRDCTLKLFPQPYCHCPAEEIPLSRSLIGTLGPAVTTGIVPIILAVISQNFIILLLGGYGIAMAGMDILHSLLRIPFIRVKGSLYKDEKALVGGIVYIPQYSFSGNNCSDRSK